MCSMVLIYIHPADLEMVPQVLRHLHKSQNYMVILAKNHLKTTRESWFFQINIDLHRSMIFYDWKFASLQMIEFTMERSRGWTKSRMTRDILEASPSPVVLPPEEHDKLSLSIIVHRSWCPLVDYDVNDQDLWAPNHLNSDSNPNPDSSWIYGLVLLCTSQRTIDKNKRGLNASKRKSELGKIL